MATRRPRRSVVALAGIAAIGERSARSLAGALAELGIETVYLGRVEDAARIARVVVNEQADAVELCIGGGPGVLLLRELLRELIAVGRRDVSIVVHRVDSIGSSVGY